MKKIQSVAADTQSGQYCVYMDDNVYLAKGCFLLARGLSISFGIIISL